MPTDVTMPKLSDTMEEGKILKWLKAVGDRVAIGDILAEVETDKANMELEAYDEGVLAELRVAEGESAPVGAVIAVLAAPGEEKGAAAPGQTSPGACADARLEGVAAARRVASEPARPPPVTGSGPGRAHRRATSRWPRRPRSPHTRHRGPGTVAGPPAGTRVELSRARRTTARRMAEAKREVPHFYASAEIPMDEAVRLKESLTALGSEYADLTYTHLVLKAAGLALRRVPELNASLDGETLVLHERVHLGLATAVDDGLLVPVVRDCDREPLAGIVRQVRGLVERARGGKPARDDLSGGTFTVSNLGMFPVSEFAAVVNPPQAAILAVAAIRATPVVRAGLVVPGKHVMTVTLSRDHRIVDGVLAGGFSAS
jgi:pyruvate dehydrogenase E2 component (dihydrolipoamide acetyltransferase)